MKLPENYNLKVDKKKLGEKIYSISERAIELKDKDLFRKIFSLIDLTSLDVADTEKKILGMVNKVNQLPDRFDGIPNVAAICVYPVFIPLLADNLVAKGVKKATVAASFPSSQTFNSIKYREVEEVIRAGADEVDIVLPVGKFLEEKYEEVFEEIRQIKEITGDKHLKVILETSLLSEPEKIRYASFLALEAGADFIKTSTGKNGPGASPEAVYIMCEAIREFYQATKKVAGIKPAGGISDPATAIQYYLIVNEVLGNEWTNPSRFRIGASKLANSLL
ncbi:MAG: deoxyribose-phosphate aldolase, partial [Bacteroidales bacterium]|nr:deoxyribose-phosphate aldolase [Bacteroidales bacterium]